MANQSHLEKLVSEYQTTYRHPGLAPFEFVERYDLDQPPVCPELAARQGVYAIFSGDLLLYIGKASGRSRAIWHRIHDHFRFGLESKKTNWSQPPTHFIAWAVPKDSFFEASALEEFLIYRLKDELPDNRVGR